MRMNYQQLRHLMNYLNIDPVSMAQKMDWKYFRILAVFFISSDSILAGAVWYVGGVLPPHPYIVGQIIITGNHKTGIILSKGSWVSKKEIRSPFQHWWNPSACPRRLINTRLFNEIVIYLKGFRGYITDIEIDVKSAGISFLFLFQAGRSQCIRLGPEGYQLNRVNYGPNSPIIISPAGMITWLPGWSRVYPAVWAVL